MDKQHTDHTQPLTMLIFSASLRNDSLNTRLVKLAMQVIEQNNAQADYADMSEFDCPSFNQDLDNSGSLPPGAEAFNRRLLGADAFIIASPEYNGSIPGYLKNSIDWVSRFQPQPFNGRHGLLMSASPSMAGGNRGLWCLRIPFEHLGARIFPDMFSLAMAHKAFTPEGTLSNATLAKRFEDNIAAFISFVEAAKNYPCLKKTWIEFLGEKPDPIIERVA